MKIRKFWTTWLQFCLVPSFVVKKCVAGVSIAEETKEVVSKLVQMKIGREYPKGRVIILRSVSMEDRSH